jgi:IS5 family transposase
MRFLGLQLKDWVPDAKTAWLFRKRLKGLNLMDVLFARFHLQLAVHGYIARTAQMNGLHFCRSAAATQYT